MILLPFAQFMLIRAAALVLAALLDFIAGDPFGMIHPVVGIGKLIGAGEKLIMKLRPVSAEREEDAQRKKTNGIILVVAVCIIVTGIAGLIIYLAGLIHWAAAAVLQFIMCWQMLAGRSLAKAADGVYKALKEEGLDGARHAVSMIVGRDTEGLDEKGVIKATVETVAENTSDGIVAPALFFMVLGIPGMYFYKAVNTMDSMLGYKNDKYIYFGRAAAKLDDVMNFVPARVAGVFMILSAYIAGFDGKGAARIFRRDRKKHASPNAAQTESACAGALGIQLAGDAVYFGKVYEKPFIGDDVRPVEAEDIKRSVRLMFFTGATVIAGGAICIILTAGIYTAIKSFMIFP